MDLLPLKSARRPGPSSVGRGPWVMGVASQRDQTPPLRILHVRTLLIPVSSWTHVHSFTHLPSNVCESILDTALDSWDATVSTGTSHAFGSL